MVENVIIIGSGPAGLSAAIYTSREEFNPLVIAGAISGGQLLLTTTVDNMPGFPEGIQGPEIIERMEKQAARFGTRFIKENVTDVDFSKRPFRVFVGSKAYEANSVILATGANAKLLGIPSEMKFMGVGVSTCATCLTPSSLIVANASTKEISSIMTGSRVLTIDGSFRKVSEIMTRKYKGRLISFKTRYFRSELTELTPNHEVLVMRLERGTGPYYWKMKWIGPTWSPASDLKINDMVLYPIPQEIKKSPIINISKELNLNVDQHGKVMLKNETYSSHRIKNLVKVDKQLARLFGYYLSEGFAHERGISFAFSSKEYTYANECAKIIKKHFGITSTIKKENSVIRITAHSKILSLLFDKFFGTYSSEKHLPHEYALVEKEIQKEIILGMWRGDGCMRKKDFIITTSSRELVEQLKLMLLRLGVLPGVEKRKFDTLRLSNIDGRKAEFKSDVYQLIVGGPWLKQMSKIVEEQHPILKHRSRMNFHAFLTKTHAILPIKEIRKREYNGLVYNLAVSGNNTYVTTNSIVHNCDGPFFKNKDVAVIGGGDTAMEDSLFLTKFCTSVTIIHRRDQFRASKIMQQKVLSNPKIKVLWNTEVEEILGDSKTLKVSGIKVKDAKNNKTSTLKVEGVFVAIGHSPNTGFLKGKIKLDELGYIVTRNEVLTDIDGIFVAGDDADRYYRQAGTAAASGIKAALRVRDYLQNMKK